MNNIESPKDILRNPIPIINFPTDGEIRYPRPMQKNSSLFKLKSQDVIFDNFFIYDIFLTNRNCDYQDSFLIGAETLLDKTVAFKPDLIEQISKLQRPTKIIFVQSLKNYLNKINYVNLDEIPKEQTCLHKCLSKIKAEHPYLRPSQANGYNLDHIDGVNKGFVGMFKALELVWPELQ